MGEEAYDEFELESADPGDLRTVVVRGGYSRDEVYVGICRNASEQPTMLVAVDGKDLKRALRKMVIGTPRRRKRR